MKLTNVDDADDLQSKYEQQKKILRTYRTQVQKLELENQQLKKGSIVKIEKLVQVEPSDYKILKKRVHELEIKCKKQDRMIQFGNISTVESLVDEIKVFLTPKIEKIGHEMTAYAAVRDNVIALRDLVDYISDVELNIKGLLLNLNLPSDKDDEIMQALPERLRRQNNVMNDPRLFRLIGEQIRLLREQKNISLSKAATSIGVDYRTWGRWERGERIPTDAILAITDYFGIDPPEFFQNIGSSFLMDMDPNLETPSKDGAE